jgi:hypothetical protein
MYLLLAFNPNHLPRGRLLQVEKGKRIIRKSHIKYIFKIAGSFRRKMAKFTRRGKPSTVPHRAKQINSNEVI